MPSAWIRVSPRLDLQVMQCVVIAVVITVVMLAGPTGPYPDQVFLGSNRREDAHSAAYYGRDSMVDCRMGFLRYGNSSHVTV